MVAVTYFVHSITTDNQKKIATGWLPGELSELGVERAEQLRDMVAGRQFDAVFCSDLKRAVDTAQIAFGDRYAILQDDRLRECHYGTLDGKPKIFKNNTEDFIDHPFPGGECYRDVEARVESFCGFLKEKYDGKRVAIVSHHAPQLALDVILKGKSWPEAIAEDWRATQSWQPGWQYIIP
ncbi:MAG TPA: histidine phosphatase family protein [Candidatus Saccharimonadales bacterium]